MSKKASWLSIALIIIAFIITGYVRDFIMVNLNYLLDFVKKPDKEFYAHSVFYFLKNRSFKELYYGKYLLTLIFTLINLGLGIAFIKSILEDKKPVLILTGIYAVVFASAAIIFLVGLLTGTADQAYTFSRALMGFLQSPVPCAMLLLSYRLYRQNA